MQPMSQAEVEAGEARQWLMQRGWALEETFKLERSARSKGSEFNTKVLVGLGPEGLAELRAHLAKSEDVKPARGEDLVCFLSSIGKGSHFHPQKNPVQKQPFSRAGRDGKWIEMKKPRQPMCESCTSTIRKHYTGATNSPELVAAFVHEVEVYKCHSCGAWNQGAAAVAASNMTCTVCGWTAGRKKKLKAKKEPAAVKSQQRVGGSKDRNTAAAPTQMAKMLAATAMPVGQTMIPPNLPPPPVPRGTPPDQVSSQLFSTDPSSASPVPRRITGDMPDDLARVLSDGDLKDIENALAHTRSENAALIRELSLSSIDEDFGANHTDMYMQFRLDDLTSVP